ncbi:hypothetical protein GOP47_0022357 [Adiantum capillus-veneris]|uniref:Purple acid phosphatase n=1 Tax=Adiantum capillus-veneris TaxID=13818 RepID=A0A9D4U6C8_ADICA|nr:hypothetical protein GOP47_0022357 [Adiantum capillus-veneris]
MARCSAAVAASFVVSTLLLIWSCWHIHTSSGAPWAISGSHTSLYVRSLEASVDMPLDADVFQVPPGFNAPQQVHITQGDYFGKAVIVSWITPYEVESPNVYYGTDKENYSLTAMAELTTTYTAYNYTSGFIHHCTLDNLEYNTTYYYKLGEGNVMREFSFTTPPECGPDMPYTFGLIGDLGQTADSNATVEHYVQSKGQTVLLVGDCSYADKYPFYDNNRWDTWGRFIERSAAYQPWLWTPGNHDIESGPTFGEFNEFKSYMHRLQTPYMASQSTSPLWYAIQRGPAYIISLSSYSSFVTYSPQYQWLKAELLKVDRTKTPWLIVMMHVPLYNSNCHHYLEGEAMRSVFEAWFVEYKVDIVFAGHVHAYERSHPVSNVLFNLTNDACQPIFNEDAPTYVVIGDGGNVEGLAVPYMEPQPEYSAFREASFGHGLLDIMNRTHALFSWHRNQDGLSVVADSAWLNNQYWKSSSRMQI